MISLFLGNLRGWEWLIILVVILILFGGKKIPELMRGLGKGVRGFKEGLKGAQEEIAGDDKTASHCDSDLKKDASSQSGHKKDSSSDSAGK